MICAQNKTNMCMWGKNSQHQLLHQRSDEPTQAWINSVMHTVSVFLMYDSLLFLLPHFLQESQLQ